MRHIIAIRLAWESSNDVYTCFSQRAGCTPFRSESLRRHVAEHHRCPPSPSAISKTPTVFHNKAQGSPLFPNDKNPHGFGITHRQPQNAELTNLRKSGVPWVNVSSILFFSGAAHSSQPFMSAPLKNLGSPALRHVDKTPPSQQDSRMKRLTVRGFTFSRGTSGQSHCWARRHSKKL